MNMFSFCSSFLRRVLLALLVAGVVLPGAGCDNTTSPTPVTSPVTETWAGSFQPNGAASRSFIAAQAGEVRLQLLSTTPVNITFGLGFGTADADGRNCTITDSVLTASSADAPQIVKAVTAGTYCARVHDPGNLVVTNGSFVVSIVRP